MELFGLIVSVALEIAWNILQIALGLGVVVAVYYILIKIILGIWDFFFPDSYQKVVRRFKSRKKKKEGSK